MRLRFPLREAGLAWVLTLGLLGCPGAPAVHYYLLGPAAVDRAVRGPSGTATLVGVRTFEVDAPYDQDRIVYRLGRDGVEVGFYAYHRWAAPLGDMLPAIVASRLDEASPPITVEAALPGRAYDAWITGRLIDLVEVDHAGGQDVHVAIELTLEQADGSRVWSAAAERSATLDTREVAAVVAAMNNVASEVVDELRPQLEHALEALVAGRGAPAR